MNSMAEEIGALVRERRPPRITEQRRLRIEAGLRLRDIAERVGVAEPTVWYWECGVYEPSGEHAARYAAVLDAIRSALAETPEQD